MDNAHKAVRIPVRINLKFDTERFKREHGI
jgi:hypothetical protein